MPVLRTSFGQFDGREASLFTLDNGNGVIAKITDYGGILTELHVPGRDGNTADVVLGFDKLDDYLAGHPFFGAVVGRCANRIPAGKFTLDGVEYQLDASFPFGNHLHGGKRGFDKYIWDSKAYEQNGSCVLELSRVSEHMEEGYPGELKVTATYTLSADNVLTLDFSAETDRPTIINMVNHSYFNLAGHASGTIENHKLQIDADAITPVNDCMIPTGEITPVAGTAHDFRSTRLVAEAMGENNGQFDMNFVLNGEQGQLRRAAVLTDPDSGRVMTVSTTAPGIQFYNGFKLGEQAKVGKGDNLYPACAALCLETQAFPNAVNTPAFPSVVLRPGEQYRHTTTYAFSIDS